MPRNGAGVFSLVNNTWFPPVNGVLATSVDWNTFIIDIQNALTQSVSSDGQTPMTGNLPMGNNKITGMANGTAATDAATVGQMTGRLLNIQAFTVNGTYTPTVGTTRILVRGQGAGGGGAPSAATGAGQVSIGGGGGAGGYGEFFLTSGFTPSVAITVAAGGASGAGAGATVFGAIFQWNGGNTGTTSAAGATGTAGGGSGGTSSASAIYGVTGQTAFSIQSRFSDGSALSGSGANSYFGSGGDGIQAGGGSNAGFAATGFGSGGGGSSSFGAGAGAAGGAGAGGIIIVYEYA